MSIAFDVSKLDKSKYSNDEQGNIPLIPITLEASKLDKFKLGNLIILKYPNHFFHNRWNKIR